MKPKSNITRAKAENDRPLEFFSEREEEQNKSVLPDLPVEDDNMVRELKEFGDLADRDEEPILDEMPQIPRENKAEVKIKLSSTDKVRSKANLMLEEWREEIKELEQTDSSSALEQLYDSLGLLDQDKYRAKMKGFVAKTYFTERNKVVRNKALKNKILDSKTAREVKKILDIKKQDREDKERQVRERIAKKELEKRERILAQFKKAKEKQNQQESNRRQMKSRKMQEKYNKDQNTKLTWDLLEKMQPDQFINNEEDDFDPAMLIEEGEINDFEFYNQIVGQEEDLPRNSGKRSAFSKLLESNDNSVLAEIGLS